MTLIIISKGIDLAAGSTVALVGMVAASLAQTTDATTKVFPNMGELTVIVPVLAAILLGAAIGGINGSLIAYASLPAFIATLGMQTIVRGTALMYTQGKPISNFTDSFMSIGSRIGWLPVPVLIYAICIAATWILLGYTRFGKSVYAIGGNINAARVSGINVKRNIVLIYVYAGFLFGILFSFAGRVGSVIQCCHWLRHNYRVNNNQVRVAGGIGRFGAQSSGVDPRRFGGLVARRTGVLAAGC